MFKNVNAVVASLSRGFEHPDVFCTNSPSRLNVKHRWCRRPPPPGHSDSLIERFPAAPVSRFCGRSATRRSERLKALRKMKPLKCQHSDSAEAAVRTPTQIPAPPASPSPAPTVSERMTTVMAWHITASHKALGSLCVSCRRPRRKPRPLAPSAARLRM